MTPTSPRRRRPRRRKSADVAGAGVPIVRAPVDEPRRLATTLARIARRVWPELDADERSEAGAAVDAFVDAPTPARFVAAARALIRARQSRHTEALRAVWGERAFTRAAAQLGDIRFVDEALLATLTAQPRDAAAARRLATLASLLLAHAELAARLRTPDLGPAPLRSDRRSGSG